MRIIADLHIHSRHSRATSKQLTVDNLEKYARIKGVNLLSTGDFTHPEWMKELKSTLSDDGTGVLRTKSGFPFILQSEVSLIYTHNKRGRKIHNIIYAPSFDVVEQITEYLKKHGRVDYDGRPIFNITCPDLVYELKKISNEIEIVPAHVWTPWFSLFGSNSGFNSVEEAFQDQTKHIFALETGLSSDPAMNWRLSSLDRFSLVSNSDLHSFWPWRLGREANVFEVKQLSYKAIMDAIKTRKGFVETIEVDPSYGKYHFDGHRNCGISLEPKEAIKLNNVCPVCGNPLTIGVLHRVEELADRPEGFVPKNAVPFRKLLPLSELISKILGKGLSSNFVWKEYYKLVREGRTEFEILLYTPFEELKEATTEKIAQAIIDNREGRIKVRPGYDGEYGFPILGEEKTFEDKKEKKVLRTPGEKQRSFQKGLRDYF